MKLPSRAKPAPIIGLALLLVAGVAQAEVFKWTDSQGRVQFSDKQPAKPGSKVEKVKIEVVTYSFVKTTPLKTPLPGTRPGQVALYGAQWCAYCKKAEQYFQKNKIPYRYLDIENDSHAKSEWQALGGGGIPVIIAGRQRMNGFSPEAFQAIYR